MKRLFSILLLVATSFGMVQHGVASANAQSNNTPSNNLQELYADKGYTGISYLSVSSEGNTRFYANNKSGQRVLVRDGLEVPEPEYVPEPDNTAHSLDGMSTAIIIAKGNKRVMTVDGIEGKEYDWVWFLAESFDDGSESHPGKITKFFPSKSEFVFMTIRDGRYFLVKNNEEINTFNLGINGFGFGTVFSPDKKSFILAAMRDDRMVVIKDGVDVGIYDPYVVETPDEYDLWMARYSKDGKHYAFFVPGKNGQGRILIKDGKEIDTTSNGSNLTDSLGAIKLSNDGSRFAYLWPNDTGGFDLIRDGKKTIADNNHNYFGYSPDGKDFYSSDTNGRLIWNGNAITSYTRVVFPGFSPNSQYFVFAAKKDGKEVIVRMARDGVQTAVVEPNKPSSELSPLQAKLSALIEKRSSGDQERKKQIIATLKKNIDRIIARETNTKKMALLQELRAFLYQ